MEIQVGGQPVQAKVLRVTAKVSDLGVYTLLGDQGQELAEHDGYVPEFMPGEHYGDYIELEIDVESGQLLNWKPPSKRALEKFVRESTPRD